MTPSLALCVDAAALIPAARGGLVEQAFSGSTDAAALLALIQEGVVGLDDAWAQGKAIPGLPHPPPRVLAWAWGQRGGEASSRLAPSEQAWAEALAASRGELTGTDAAHPLSARDRVLAWAFSDARAWTWGPVAATRYEGWDCPMGWAARTGQLWVLEAGLRQPDRPAVPAQWLAGELAHAVVWGNAPVLERLARLGPRDVADIRARVVEDLETVQGQRVEVGAQGQPLLHMARDAHTVRVLLEIGAPPDAQDAQGLRPDQVWLAREAQGGSAGDVSAMIAALASYLATIPGDAVGQEVRAIHGERVLTDPAQSLVQIDAWLAGQPDDFTVGAGLALPAQALWKSTLAPPLRAKRATRLMGRLSVAAMQGEDTHGVRQWVALWWMVAMDCKAEPGRQLKRHLPQALTTEGWQVLLAAAPGLLARIGSAPWAMGRTCLHLAHHVLAQSLGEAAQDNALPAWAVPTPEGGWPDGATQTVDALAGGASQAARQADNSGLGDDLIPVLEGLARHAGAFAHDDKGQARHNLMDACVGLFVHAVSGVQVARLAPTVLMGALEGREAAAGMGGEGAPLALAKAIGVLARAGARPTPATLAALRARGGLHDTLAAWVLAQGLGQQLDAPNGGAGPRLRL